MRARAADARPPIEEALHLDERVVRLPTRPGVELPVLYARAQGPEKGCIIALPGGDGRLELSEGGIGRMASNFAVATRHRFAREGYSVAVVDAPSDHPQGVDHYRVTAKQAYDLSALIDWIKRRSPNVPIYLLATSRGTISAASAAQMLPAGRVAGLILTSSVTRGDRTSLRDVAVERIRVPTLIVHEDGDACPSSPLSGAFALRDRFVRADRADMMRFDGALAFPGANPCSSDSAHGFAGERARVVRRIASWIEEVTRTGG